MITNLLFVLKPSISIEKNTFVAMFMLLIANMTVRKGVIYKKYIISLSDYQFLSDHSGVLYNRLTFSLMPVNNLGKGVIILLQECDFFIGIVVEAIIRVYTFLRFLLIFTDFSLFARIYMQVAKKIM